MDAHSVDEADPPMYLRARRVRGLAVIAADARLHQQNTWPVSSHHPTRETRNFRTDMDAGRHAIALQRGTEISPDLARSL
jgi:hypothetical protein